VIGKIFRPNSDKVSGELITVLSKETTDLLRSLSIVGLVKSDDEMGWTCSSDGEDKQSLGRRRRIREGNISTYFREAKYRWKGDGTITVSCRLDLLDISCAEPSGPAH
jgi:hypothetical protein